MTRWRECGRTAAKALRRRLTEPGVMRYKSPGGCWRRPSSGRGHGESPSVSGTRPPGASLPLLAAAGGAKLRGVAAFGATTGCGTSTSPGLASGANFGRSSLIYQRLSHDVTQRKGVRGVPQGNRVKSSVTPRRGGPIVNARIRHFFFCCALVFIWLSCCRDTFSVCENEPE
jgi:hypothetical protein